jgi:hypothetical protein
MLEESKIMELHVKPTYAVLIPQRQPSMYGKTERQKENEKNLKKEKLTGVMSEKASKRLKNAINWLVASAKNKTVYSRSAKKHFNFKLNFVTLTLPTTDHDISDHFFKSKLLHNFINVCRNSHGLRNYVWKVETQANGNIHAHFTTDTFIHHSDLRRVWNKILKSNGILEKYTNKHLNMTEDEYINSNNPKNQKHIETLRKRFIKGTSEGWTNPNTTDVHSVFKVDDLASYLCKYMTKNDTERRKIKGRLWGCSYNLSENNKLVIEIKDSQDSKYVEHLLNPEINYKVIEGISALTRLPYRIGEIFLYKMSDWGRIIGGALLDKYNEHRFNIRHNINIQAPVPSVNPEPVIKKVYEIVTFKHFSPYQTKINYS